MKKKSNKHAFMREIVNKLEIKGNLLNLIKGIYKKSTAKIMFNGERQNAFLPKIRNKTRTPTLTTFVQNYTRRKGDRIKKITPRQTTVW